MKTNVPYQYANLTSFTTFSRDFDSYKINNNSNISTLNLDIDKLNEN